MEELVNFTVTLDHALLKRVEIIAAKSEISPDERLTAALRYMLNRYDAATAGHQKK